MPVPTSFHARLFIYPAVLFITACFALPAFAQDINAQQAAHLKKVFQTILENRQAEIAQKTDRPRKLTLEGDVIVEPVETYYAITMPRMGLAYEDGTRVDIGIVALNASPHDQPKQYKMTMSLPTPILGFDAQDQEIMRLSIGTQKTAGIWHEDIETFIKLDAEYNDIAIAAATNNAQMNLQKLLIRYDLNESADKRWSGPIRFEADNFSIKAPENAASLSLDKLLLSITLDELLDEALLNSPTEEASAETEYKMADGIDATFALTGLELSKNINNEGTENITLGSGGIRFNFDNALSGSVDANFNMNFKDLSSSNIPADLKALIPQNGALNLTHYNIPIDSINQLMANKTDENAKTFGLSLMLKVPALMAQAGSYIETKDSFISNQDYNIAFNSILRADIAAVNSATAKATMRFTGFDKVLSMAQVAGRNLYTSTYAAPMRSLARLLERLKPLARIETTEDKGYVHIFDFVMDETGRVLINGQAALPLLQDQKPEPAKPPVLENPEEPVGQPL